MKKVKTAAALLCSACLVLSGTAVPTMADSVKVVTLGADLTQDQKNTMMKYFNVDSNQVQILTITNQDERDHLSAYVPLEQIGTRTVSCAYVSSGIPFSMPSSASLRLSQAKQVTLSVSRLVVIISNVSLKKFICFSSNP